ncbi:carbohydrate ABC transporter permease [Ruania halotolerans]|uniref:carbohydrate ABC transporter permease n=1 Tax=Ruania halotolerans TaxID=2897773 RepID=UPI001E575A28|nr:carbohydrate ABC transporter permease [Ruania halotolerans]UFU05431.1 carbohydrate ABC transporter permease [Ruania halotolerans]
MRAFTTHRRRLPLTILAAAVGILFAIPLLWVLTNSLRPGAETFGTISPLGWETFLTLTPNVDNYTALAGTSLGRGILNSIIVSVATVAVGLVICAMAAFALAALPFRGRSAVFSVIVLSFLIPFDAIAIPLADVFRTWNLQNTFTGLILPGLGNGMAIFLLRQFFLAVPEDLAEAARLDGLGWWGIFSRIYAPLARPAMIGAALMLFLFQWQAYVWPLLIGTDSEHILGPVALANMQGQFSVDYGLMFAGAVVLIAVPLVIILTLQRYFIQSVTTSGLK